MKLSIILCVYNEIRVIEKSFQELYRDCESKEMEYEIIIVDNNSSDGTKEWLDSLENPSVTKVFNEKNIGKGGSIKKGIGIASGKFLIIFDPDQEYETQSIWDCLNKIESSGAQCILGSRRLEQHRNYKYAINYYGVVFLSSFINLLYNTSLTDTATAIKCFNTKFLKNVPLVSDGFNLDFELVCRVARLGGKIEEVNVNYFPRSKAEGKKIKALQDGFASLIVILRDRLFKLDQ
jgi:dolichol-phosphate mannosyltransferase